MNQNRRKKLVVDTKSQYLIVFTAVKHWASFLVGTIFLLLAWQALTDWHSGASLNVVQSTWRRYGPMLVVLLAFIPVIACESIKLSNRFAGPLLRLRSAVKKLANGEHVEPIKFRDGDFGGELADDFNVLLERLQSQNSGKNKVAVAAKTADDEDESPVETVNA